MQNKFEQDIKAWVNDFVSVHNETLNQIPCPYAKQAKVQYKFVERNIMLEADDMIHNWTGDYEVGIIGCPVDYINPEALKIVVDQVNATQEEFVLLRDHPNDDDIIQNVEMGNGKYVLVFVQKRKALQEASDKLKQAGSAP